MYKNGKIVDWNYIISDEPMEDEEAESGKNVESTGNSTRNLDAENLDSENLNQGIQDLGKPHDYKISNNKESNDKISINHSAENQSFQQSFQHQEAKKNDKIDRQNRHSEKREEIKQIIKTNIEYDWYEKYFAKYPDNSSRIGKATYARNIGEIDMLVEAVINTVCSDKEFFRIKDNDISHDTVESVFMKLEMRHIEYALKNSLIYNMEDISNPTAYFRTVLYDVYVNGDYLDAHAFKNDEPEMCIPKWLMNEVYRE